MKNFFDFNKEDIFSKTKYLIIGVLIVVSSQFVVSFIPVQFPDKIKVAITIVGLALYLLLMKIGRENHLARNAFLLILIFGTVVSLIKPIQYGLDEESHLRGAISLADGQFFSRSGNQEQPDWQTIEKYDSLRSPSSKVNMQDFYSEVHHPSQYSGQITGINNISRLPNALGWAIGKIISPKIFVSYYLGRIFNVLAYALLALLALKISKKYKEVLYIFAVFPTNIWIVAGYQYDYLFLGLSLILLAMFTEFVSEKAIITRGKLAGYLITSLLMVFPKFPYVLIGVLPLFISREHYKNIKDKMFYLIFLIVGFILSILYYFNSTILTSLFGEKVTNGGGGAATSIGVMYFIKHPLPVIRTIITDGLTAIGSFAGMNVRNNPPAPIQYAKVGSVFMDTILPIIFITLLIVVSVRLDVSINKVIKATLIVIYLLISIATIYAMTGDPRLGFNKDSLSINGVQFRYFYMMIASIPLFFSEMLKKILPLSIMDKDKYDLKISKLLQNTLLLVNLLVIGIGIYTLS